MYTIQSYISCIHSMVNVQSSTYVCIVSGTGQKHTHTHTHTSERVTAASFIPLNTPSFLPNTRLQWYTTPGGSGHELANSCTRLSGRTTSVDPDTAMVKSGDETKK